MKTCIKCQKPKELGEFNRRRALGPEARNNTCASCQADYRRAYYRANITALKASLSKSNTKRRAGLYEVVNKLKDRPCADCGGRFNPWQMDFDHKKAANKEAEISRMVVNMRPISKILEEASKCEVVCACCHRDRTYRQFRPRQSKG